MSLGMVLFLVAVLATPAFAADPGAIELSATAEKLVLTTDEEGTERTEFVKAEVVVPGDQIAYTIAAKNVSAESVEQVVITDPIPAEMRFVAGSEESQNARVQFSVDGGSNFDLEDRLVVRGEDGQTRPASPADFTHIRWTFEAPLDPDSERAVRFLAVVE